MFKIAHRLSVLLGFAAAFAQTLAGGDFAERAPDAQTDSSTAQYKKADCQTERTTPRAEHAANAAYAPTEGVCIAQISRDIFAWEPFTSPKTKADFSGGKKPFRSAKDRVVSIQNPDSRQNPIRAPAHS